MTKSLLLAILVVCACRGPSAGGLRLDGPPRACEAGETLEVTGEGIGVLTEPLQQLHAENGLVVASYSGHWAETRLVTLRFPAHSRVEVAAEYSTDYGDFAGIVLPDSRVHTHEDGVCFDLSVVRGSEGRTERWRGRVRLPFGMRPDER